MIIVVFQGDVDNEQTGAFQDALATGLQTSQQQGEDLGVDLGRVTFLGKGALAALIRMQQHQQKQGRLLHLVAVSGFVRERLDRIGMTAFFSITSPTSPTFPASVPPDADSEDR